MNVAVRHELNETNLIIEKTVPYEQDYQIRMLMENEYRHLLETTACGIDGKSRYIYNISGRETMESMYETDLIDKMDMITVVEQMVEAIEEAQTYLLDVNCFILSPEYIFYEKGIFYFCYYPLWEESLCEGFHKLTEFFVQKLNYENQEGVIMAFELHKATLTKNYDIEGVMHDIEVQTAEIKKSISLPDREKASCELWEDDWIEENAMGIGMVREMGEEEETGLLNRLIGRYKKPKWGKWEDLLMAEESSIIQGR